MVLLSCAVIYRELFLLFTKTVLNGMDKIIETDVSIMLYNFTAPQTTPSKMNKKLNEKQNIITFMEELLSVYSYIEL